MTDQLFSLRLVQAVFYENDERRNPPSTPLSLHTLYLVEGAMACARNTVLTLPRIWEAC